MSCARRTQLMRRWNREAGFGDRAVPLQRGPLGATPRERREYRGWRTVSGQTVTVRSISAVTSRGEALEPVSDQFAHVIMLATSGPSARCSLGVRKINSTCAA